MSVTEGAAELHAAWRLAADQHQQIDSPRTSHREQEAHDALVDYVEAHGLNYSEFDPRSGDDPDVARALRDAAEALGVVPDLGLDLEAEIVDAVVQGQRSARAYGSARIRAYPGGGTEAQVADWRLRWPERPDAEFISPLLAPILERLRESGE